VSKPELRGLSHDLRPLVPALTALNQRSVPLYSQLSQASSCQNDVILPWTKDKIDDKTFPARGPVYEEATKPLPGLAGESRSGDANGQWFRVLAAGGTNLVQLAPGEFGTTTNPILGANPPKPKSRPPLDETQPCENQETPDLRSQPADPPQQWQADTSSQLFKDRYALAKGRAVDWLKDQLKREHLADKLKVSDEDATKGLIDSLAQGKTP